MLPRIKGKIIRSKYNNRLNIKDKDKESLEYSDLNRLVKDNINDKVLDDIYKSKAPQVDIKLLTPEGGIIQPSVLLNKNYISKEYGTNNSNLVEALRPEHRYIVKSSELDNNKVSDFTIEIPKSKVIAKYEKTENKILDTLQQHGGIYKLSQESEIIEFIDIYCKLEKAIEHNFDKNWFVYKISDKSQLYGKADLLLSNHETGESISLQLKLKESTMNHVDLFKLGQLYKHIDIIIVGFKNKEILDQQIKIVENMSRKISPKIHFVDLNPYYNNEESYYNYDKILHIIKESRLNKDKALYYEEQYNKKFESLEHLTKQDRSFIDAEARLVTIKHYINIKLNIVEPTIIKKEYICSEYSIVIINIILNQSLIIILIIRIL